MDSEVIKQWRKENGVKKKDWYWDIGYGYVDELPGGLRF